MAEKNQGGLSAIWEESILRCLHTSRIERLPVCRNKTGVLAECGHYHPDELVRFNLHFRKPMEATNVSDFTFAPAGDQTLVTWSMTGTNGFMGKAFSVIMNMDKLVGADFEKGLANLEAVVKAPAPAARE